MTYAFSHHPSGKPPKKASSQVVEDSVNQIFDDVSDFVVEGLREFPSDDSSKRYRKVS